MKQFLCKSCGQPLIRQGNNYICNYCGNVWIADLANDIHAVERANAWEALRKGDFEKATELFDEILLKNSKDYEAFWGKALSLNAILYVIDLSEDKRVPTCNNITENSFFSSKEVQSAISLAPSDIALSYKKQAEYIEKVRLEWLEKASKEPEYDVFISFKDSDRERGIERTQDSIDAQDLYNLLTAEGLKVFFSRISLRNKVSEQYEPYIYNAIKTAKVMIVFGEKIEYFTAPWIKNEWRRYLSRIESGEKHRNSLVVAYKDIDVGSLPQVLSSKQCLNAEDMSFSALLLRHINAIIEDYNKNKKIKRVEIKGGEISKKATSISINQIQTRELGLNSVQTSISDAQKLSLVDTYLGESMFSEAQNLLNEVLVENPNSGEAIYKSLQIKYKKSPATMVDQADLALLERAILNSAKENSAKILNNLYSLDLKDDITEALLKIILPFEYEERTSQINLAFEKAIKKHNYKAFCLLLKSLNASEVDRYIDYNTRYANSAGVNEEVVIECLNRVISVDGGNVDVLDKLYKLTLVYKQDQQKALEIFEELLKYSVSPEQKIKEGIQFLNENFNASYCEFIKKILSYSSADISEYKKIILNSVKKVILGMKFDVAEQLISIITSENEQDPEVFWNICLIKTQSISADDIVNSDIALNSLPEFQKYLLLASEGDRKTALDIVKRQTQAIERKRKEAEAEELKNNCRALIEMLKELDKNGGKVNNQEYDQLTTRLKQLTALKNSWESIEKKLKSAISVSYAYEISELEEKKRKIGLFGLKRKKEIEREIKLLQSAREANREEIATLKSKKQGFNSYQEVCNALEATQNHLNALKSKQNLRTSADIRAELNKTDVGRALLLKYDEQKNAKVGSIIKFGKYPQSNANTKEDIEWLVLDKQGTKALVISKYALDCKKFNEQKVETTWEQSSLRKWLNSEFVNKAFSAEEGKMIQNSYVSADKNLSYGTNPGKATNDKVFLLSINEANKYFANDKAMECKPTAYTKGRGAYVVEENGNCEWWLRSPGFDQFRASIVYYRGRVHDSGSAVDNPINAVRPALWINL